MGLEVFVFHPYSSINSTLLEAIKHPTHLPDYSVRRKLKITWGAGRFVVLVSLPFLGSSTRKNYIFGRVGEYQVNWGNLISRSGIEETPKRKSSFSQKPGPRGGEEDEGGVDFK